MNGRASRFWPVLIALTAAAAFSPALGNRWTFDDVPLVAEAPMPRTLGELWAGLARPWWPPDHAKTLWRPLTRLTIDAQRMIGGEAASRSLYALNIVLHMGAALALGGLARALGWSPRAAGTAGLLFAVHPFHTEPVHQIVGRAELLAALFMLLGLRALAIDGTAGRKAWTAQPLCGALAMASKEHAVIYPFLALLMLAGRQRDAAARRLAWRSGRTWAMVGILAAAAALMTAARAAVTGGLIEPPSSVPFHENPLAQRSFLERAPIVLGLLGWWAARAVVPVGLAPDYAYRSFPIDQGWRWGWTWVGVGVALALAIGSLRDARRGGRGWLLVTAGAAAWLLTSNAVFPIGVIAAGRLWYAPMAAACLGAGWMLDRLMARARPPVQRWGAWGLAAATVLLMSASWHEAPAWASPRAHAQRTIDRFPESWRGRVNLAREDYRDGDFAAGLAHARVAVAVLPEQPFGWYWVGMNAMFLDGHAAEAEAAFRRALALNPALNEIHRHLANLYQMHGRRRDAAAALRAYLAGPEVRDRDAIETRLRELER